MTTIYIPTHHRPHNQRTWDLVSTHWRDRTWLVCQDKKEAERYDLLGYPVLCAPVSSLPEKRQWVMENHDCATLGTSILFIDDDLTFAVRREDDPVKLRQLSTEDDFNAMMEAICAMAAQVPFAGLIPRQNAAWTSENGRYVKNSRVGGVHIMDVEETLSRGYRFDRTLLHEDMDMALQYLRSGQEILLLNSYAYNNSRGSNAPGGCSTYRTPERMAFSAHQLADLHPGFVTVTERPPWRGMETPRTDVRVQWQRAYKAGVQRRTLLGG